MAETDPNPAERREGPTPPPSPAEVEIEEHAHGQRPWATVVGVVGSLLVFAAIVLLMKTFAPPGVPAPEGDGGSAAQRIAEQRAKDRERLTSYGWQDQAKGITRIPIARAMELIAAEAARSRAGTTPAGPKGARP
jgi:hypothetical protein